MEKEEEYTEEEAEEEEDEAGDERDTAVNEAGGDEFFGLESGWEGEEEVGNGEK